MTYSRHRNDNNKAEIIKELRKAGCFVADLSQTGNGVPDILVCRAGKWYPIEIKSSPKDRLTPAEDRWWTATGIKPVIARTPIEALSIVGLKPIG